MNSLYPETTVDAVFVGHVRLLWPGKEPSAIFKTRTDNRLTVSFAGLFGDEQADLVNHGGTDKAIHHYPADHYPFWREEFGAAATDFGPGRFGENLSTIGLTEADLCIGDHIRIGTALVQISQGRQPCWKLSTHTGIDQMAYRVQKTARTGWYYRVLEEGELGAGDHLRVVDRPNPLWSVERVTRARFDRHLDPAIAAELAQLPELARGWRASFLRMVDPTFSEDTSKRLLG